MTEALDRAGERYRILLLPDHATPCAVMTHTAAPVPYLLYDSGVAGRGGVFTEAGVSGSDPLNAHLLMGRLLAPI